MSQYNRERPVTVVVAKDVLKLKEALQGVPDNGSWLVGRGWPGHASIMVYDGDGALHTTIRNKD